MSSLAGSWRLLYRIPLLLLHLLIGLPLTLLAFLPLVREIRYGGRTLSVIMQCWWAANLCRIFGIRRQVGGQFEQGPVLVAANHVSWLDIQVLHGISPMAFVAKAEIENWPLAGWVAGFGDTVFHQRGSHDSASSVAGIMQQRLSDGVKVAIFPEGGILEGDGVKRFHARLFAAAIESGKAVQPVMLRYVRKGRLHPEITFLPNEHFMANFFRLLRQPPCVAEVAILDPIDPQGRQRRDLATQAQAAVEAAFAAPVTTT